MPEQRIIKAEEQSVTLGTYIIAVFSLVIGHSQICEVSQAQHTFQHVIRAHDKGLAPSRREWQRLS